MTHSASTIAFTPESHATRDVFFTLSPKAQSELKAYLAAIPDIEIAEAGSLETVVPYKTAMPTFRTEVDQAHGIAMDEGFIVLRAVPNMSFAEWFAMGWLVATVIGEPLVQKTDTKARNVMVYDRDGISMKQGARYHQSRDGGSIHTDNVNNPTPWKTMVLSCVQPAIRGGESIFVDAHDVVEHMRSEEPEALEILGQEYWFDGRGFDLMFQRPIIDESDGGLKVRYLREYIEEGHKKQNDPLSTEQVRAMDALDAAVGKTELQFRYSLAQGECAIINDSRMFHGRTTFLDPEPPQPVYDPESGNRLYTRIWVDEAKSPR